MKAAGHLHSGCLAFLAGEEIDDRPAEQGRVAQARGEGRAISLA
jgi:hypothetical protein